MLQNELKIQGSMIPRRVVVIVSILSGLMITAGFLQKSGKGKAAVESVAAWHEEKLRQEAAEEAARAAEQKKADWLRSLPVDTRPPLAFNGAQKTISDLPLRTDQWSREIITPAGKYSSWNVSPVNDYFIVFSDGYMDEVTPQTSGKTYDHPSPFRLLGKHPGQSVSLSVFKPPATLNSPH